MWYSADTTARWCSRTRRIHRYLEDLWELKETCGVHVYAYCLMTNHVHLLLAPQATAASLGSLMKGLAGRATRYRNRLERRTGTLWESRYKSSLVQSEAYLLACSRYIELNPVRARMVSAAQDYAWSGCKVRLGLGSAESLDCDLCYLALGGRDAERRERYQRFLREAIPTDQWTLIREALQRGQLTGNSRFIDKIEHIAGRRIDSRQQGRPTRQIDHTVEEH